MLTEEEIAAMAVTVTPNGKPESVAVVTTEIPTSNGRIVADAPPLALTELGLARRMVKQFRGKARYAPQLRTWFVWDGTRFAEDITGEVLRLAKATIDELHAEALATPTRQERDELIRAWQRMQSASHIRAIVEIAETEPGVPVTITELDSYPMLLNVKNGTVELGTGELHPHDPAELHTKLVPFDYDPDATCPRWDQFLMEVFDGDEEVISFVQRFAGYSLTGDVREQMLLFAHGAGANGKSKLLGILRRVVGDYGIQLDPTVLTLSTHDQHPTALTDLCGARLVTTIETEHGRRLAEALVKQITGGDPIRARRMRCDYFEFWPSHSLWLAANHLPRITGTDLGIWRRIALVPFEQTFAGDSEDKDLEAKLLAEAPGILAWAVRGCLAWKTDGLQLPERVKVATDRYRTSQDHLGQFLAECCIIEPGARVVVKDLRVVYEKWCDAQGEKPWSAQAVGRELTNKGLESKRTGHANLRTWLGIGLVAEGE